MLRDHWALDARHVALCGHPRAGKSRLAELLVDEFGGVLVDDGAVLREAAPILLGYHADLAYTQEGKASTMSLGDRTETIRQGLGELGNYLEDRYGEFVMPIRAMERGQVAHPKAPFYIYPSVRKNQGRAYKAAGGVVLQVNRPGCVASGNAFDVWNESLVDIQIDNSGSIEDLREFVHALPSLIDALVV